VIFLQRHLFWQWWWGTCLDSNFYCGWWFAIHKDIYILRYFIAPSKTWKCVENLYQIITGWWFQTFFIFHNIWDNPSHWLIFFKMVETTNQLCHPFVTCFGICLQYHIHWGPMRREGIDIDLCFQWAFYGVLMRKSTKKLLL
jgi:hypothetical protein